MSLDTRDAPALDASPAELGMSKTERVVLLGLGATSAVPLMNFTVTGLSFVCIAVAAAYLLPARHPRNHAPLILAVLGTLAYLASSLVNATSLMAPDVLSCAAFALYFCGITLIAGNLERIFTVLVGIGVGTVFFFVAFGTALTATGGIADLWKYGVAPPTTVGVLYLAAVLRARWRAVPLLLAAVGVTSLALNYRSHALICFAVAVLLVLEQVRFRRRPLALSTKLVTVGAFGAGFSTLLSYVAKDGLFGESLREKIMSQAAEQVPSILAGRSESPLSISAIMARPFLGWGSADNISEQVYVLAQQRAIGIGFDRSYAFDYVWKLPNGSLSLHSILLGSWAEAGIVAALLPLWLLFASLYLIFKSAPAGRWAPVLMYIGLQGAWDLMFSPWSYNLIAVFAALACSYVALRALTPRRKRIYTAIRHTSSGLRTRRFRR